MTEKVPMTAQGHAALEAELKQLRTVERQRIIKAIAEARSHGDLSENAEYHAAKEAQGMNEAKVADLEDKLSRADIIDISKLSGETVKFGAQLRSSMRTPRKRSNIRSSAILKLMCARARFPSDLPSGAHSSARRRATPLKSTHRAVQSPTRS